MTTPFIPGAQDQYPPLGDWATIEGVVSTTYLERGQQMVVQWTRRWEALHEYGYVRLVNESLIPDADARFPTVQAVLDMIAMGASTLPGEHILDVWATGVGISVKVGTSEEFSRTFTVEWPAMDTLVEAVQQLHDDTEVLANNADENLGLAVADLRAELVQLNGIAAAAAQVSVDAAASSGHSAYELALANGYVGTEVEWLASLVGPQGIQGVQGEQGEPGLDGQGITVLGSVPTSATLPGGAAVGDTYLAEDTGELHTWNGTVWVNMGRLQGEKGEPGDVSTAQLNAGLAGKSDVGHTHTLAEGISDWPGASPEVTGQGGKLVMRDSGGRFYVTSPEFDYQPTPKVYVDNQVATRAPTTHTHPATGVSDSTVVGRALMTATNAAAGRTAIGAGTSNLVLGTTGSTAKAGNYQPEVDDVVGLAAALAGKVTGTATLWVGTQAEYDALPNATKIAAGFVAVIR